MDMKQANIIGECRMTLIKALHLGHVPPEDPSLALQELCKLARMVIEGQRQELHEIDQTLGRVMGYPGTPDLDGILDKSIICTGEHTPVTLASEAAEVITKYYRNPLVWLDIRTRQLKFWIKDRFRRKPF